jgi:hypothetical protein
MIFPTLQDIESTVDLLDQYQYCESVGECPFSEAQDKVDMRLHKRSIETIRSPDDKYDTFMMLHFLSEPVAHTFGIAESVSEYITENHIAV